MKSSMTKNKMKRLCNLNIIRTSTFDFPCWKHFACVHDQVTGLSLCQLPLPATACYKSLFLEYQTDIPPIRSQMTFRILANIHKKHRKIHSNFENTFLFVGCQSTSLQTIILTNFKVTFDLHEK